MKEIISRFAPQNFNDLLALGALIFIPGMWVFQAVTGKALPDQINGGILVTWSLIFNFYFRKAKDEK